VLGEELTGGFKQACTGGGSALTLGRSALIVHDQRRVSRLPPGYISSVMNLRRHRASDWIIERMFDNLESVPEEEFRWRRSEDDGGQPMLFS
jgi:hypothetical protein